MTLLNGIQRLRRRKSPLQASATAPEDAAGAARNAHSDEQPSARPDTVKAVQRTLRDLLPGESAHVSSIGASLPAHVQRRLTDFGFDEGVEVTLLRRAPLGDPCVYRVRDYELCLRRREACEIHCCRSGEANCCTQCQPADARPASTCAAAATAGAPQAGHSCPAASGHSARACEQ